MPGNICKKLVNYVAESVPIRSIKVVRCIIGLCYTAVELSTGHIGLAQTLVDEMPPGCRSYRDADKLLDLTLHEALKMVDSWNFLEASIGVSALNAAAQYLSESNLKSNKFNMITGDPLEYLNIQRSDTIAFIGYFKPILERIKDKAENVIVFERNPDLRRDEGVYPDTACEELLPKADISIISGSTLINGTLDKLIKLSSKARIIGLLGPSVPLLPEPLFREGLTFIGGVKVLEPKVLDVVALAGGTRQLRGRVEKVLIFKTGE